MTTGEPPSAPPAAGRLPRAWAAWLQWVRRPGRETAAVTAFYLLLTLAIFGPILAGPGDQIIGDGATDMERQFTHWRTFGFGQMAAGHLPLWNPHIYGGTPYFGGFQSALLYPPNWLYLVLPLTLAINSGIALHVFLAGLFTYLWVRHRGIHPVAAVMAGTLFMFSGSYFLHIFAGHLPNLCTMVWGPLILLAVDGWCDRRATPFLLLGAGALAMQILAGHPQYVFYTGVATAMYGVSRLWRDPLRLRTAAGLATIPLAGVAMSAVQLFEGMHAAAESMRGKGTSIGFAGNFSFPPENFLTLLVPDFFGDVVNTHYWGRFLLWEMCPFIGISGLVLAVYACLPPRRPGVWPCVGIAAGLFLLALGRYTPLFEPLYHYAPGFNKFRGWSKFIYPATLFMVMLAAMGLDTLLRRGNPPRALGIVLAGGAACFVGVGLWAAWSAHAGSADGPRPWSDWVQAEYYSGESMSLDPTIVDPAGVQRSAVAAAHTLFFAAGVVSVLAGVFLAGRRWRPALYVVPVLALVEVLHFVLPTLLTFDYTPKRRFAVAQFLATHDLGDGRLLDLDDQNTGMTTGGNDLWGYDPGVTRRYAELIGATQHLSLDKSDQDLKFKGAPDLYASLLRLRYFFGFQRENSQVIDSRFFDPAMVSPHVMLVPRVKVIAGRGDILAAVCPPSPPDFQPRETVILETPPSPAPAEHPRPGKAVVTAETTDTLTIEADLIDPEVLVVTDAYSDGWKARSLLPPGQGSGQTHYDVLPADYCLRAIPLAAGHHRLLLAYRPAAFLVGAWVSVVSVLLYLAAAGWLIWSRARTRQDAGAAA